MSDFVYKEPGEIVGEILRSEMDLADGQVMFSNQKVLIPTDGIYIAVSYVGPSKVIGSSNEWLDNGAGLLEIQSIVMAHLVQIDIMGFTNEVRRRKEEIAMALHSLFSESMQEQYSMQIARQPGPFLDTSYLEGTKMLTSYTTTILTTSVNQKSKPVTDYYTDFSRAVPPQIAVNA